jgi:hypothetical protein
MRKAILCIGIAALALLLLVSCGDDGSSPTGQGETPETTYLPDVPVPASPADPLPAASGTIDVGMSAPLANFRPLVSRMCQKRDDASMAWSDENRYLKMVCDGVLAQAMCDPTAADQTYVSQSPRLLHQRYWKRLKQVVLDPGTDYSHQETVSYGSSTTNSISQSFSWTIGVELTAGGDWKAFSAEVKASYSQTSTREEINSVTFSEESSFTDTYSVTSDPAKTIVFGLWQLVDVFILTDANKVPIHQSDTLSHVEIPEIGRIEFLNRDVIYQKVTKFDPAP